MAATEHQSGDNRGRLLELLQKEVATYRDILDLLKLEQKSLIDGSVEELLAQVTALERLVLSAQDLAGERFALMFSLAQEGACELPREGAELLAEIRSLSGEMNRVNAENSILIRNSLDYVRLAARLLPEQGEAPGTYRKEDGGSCVPCS